MSSQAWHLATSIFTLRGRRGTWRHVSSLCVAGVALGDIDFYLCFTWQAWHVWHCRWRAWAGVERGDAAAVGVAGVAFGDMLLGSTWQAWHSVTSTSTFVSRGRRGTYGIELALVARLGRSGTRGRCGCWRGRCGIWRHAPWFHVAGVALGDIDLYLRFTWQAWLFTLRGRRGTW